jgi:hypothetical protein
MKIQRSVFLILLLGLITPLSAQVRSRDMQAREWALTHIPDEVNKHFKKEQISLFDQIKDDFTHVQLIHNKMMQLVFVEGKADRKLIATTTAEINKRAIRLSENLVLPEIDEKTKNLKPDETQNSSGLPAGLMLLDRYIMSFISNPVFKQPNVVDPQNALKARSDLSLIIRLSDQIKKKARQPAN